jgi:hypothetical protein
VAGDWRAEDDLGGEHDALEEAEQALTSSADDLLRVPGSATPHQQNRRHSASRKAPPSRLSLHQRERLNQYRWLVGIGVVALGVRVWFVIDRWNVGPGLGTDQYWYHNVGQLIVSGKGISNPVVYALSGRLIPTASHGPLTAFVFVPLDLIGINALHAQQLIMAGIGALTVMILAQLASRWGHRAGVLAGWFGALYPGLWVFDAKVMSEPLEQFLFAVTLVLAYRLADRFTWSRAIWLGLLIGLDVLTRSELLLLVPLLLAPICFRAFRANSRRAVIARGGAALGTTLLVLAPWVGYCLTSFAHPEVLSTGLGVGLLQDNNPIVYQGPKLGSWSGWPPHTAFGIDESDLDQISRQLGLRYAEAHIGRIPAVALARLGRVWFLYRPFGSAGLVASERQSVDATLAWIWSFYGGLGFAALGVLALRKRKVLVYPLLAPVAMVTIVAVGEAGVLRFRASFEVAFVVLVGIGGDAVWTWATGLIRNSQTQRIEAGTR